MGRKPKYDDEIISLCLDGKTQAEIARALGVEAQTVRNACKRLGLKTIKCIKTSTPDDIARMLNDKQPDWEYVDGYTGSDGRFNVKHKPCGCVYEKSVVSARHGKQLRCSYCAGEKKREQAERKKELDRIWKEFNKPVRVSQIQAKVCPICGKMHMERKEKCKDCRTAEQKRYNNRYKELKKQGSHTKQSKEISARTVYEREGGKCWLCGGQCDINADPNSDYYPSVDHILPQSLGGKDTWDNVHCAHRICNSLRRNQTNIEKVRARLIPLGSSNFLKGTLRTEQQTLEQDRAT